MTDHEYIHLLASPEIIRPASPAEITLSIILPVQDASESLFRCLDSIAGQTLKDIEVICACRTSSDNSLEIIEKYRERDQRIRIAGCGAATSGAAKNAGIRLMRGEFCLFMSSDAWFSDRDACARITAGFADGADSVWFKTTVAGPEKRPPVFPANASVLPEGSCKITDRQMLAAPMQAWNKAFRASNFRMHGIAFPEEECAEDIAFHCNWFSLFRNVAILDSACLNYHAGKNSEEERTARKEEGMGFRYIAALDSIFQFWSKYGLLERRKRVFLSLAKTFAKAALQQSPPWQQCLCYSELARLLRSWDIPHSDPWLRDIQEGRLQIHVGAPLPDLTSLCAKADELHSMGEAIAESLQKGHDAALPALQSASKSHKDLAAAVKKNGKRSHAALRAIQQEQKALVEAMENMRLLAVHNGFLLNMKRRLYGILAAITAGKAGKRFRKRKMQAETLLAALKKARHALRQK